MGQRDLSKIVEAVNSVPNHFQMQGRKLVYNLHVVWSYFPCHFTRTYIYINVDNIHIWDEFL